MSKIGGGGHQPPRAPQRQEPNEWGHDPSQPVARGPDGKPLRSDGSKNEPRPEELPPEAFSPLNKKMSAEDAERIISQAGYHPAQKKKKKGLNIGDSSQAPIPLPIEDVDESEWEQGALDKSQEELTLEGSALEAATQELDDGEEMSLGSIAKLLGQKFQPSEQSIARLQKLADGAPLPNLDMGAAAGHASSMFQKELDGVPQGPALLATSLLVAGEGDSVQNTPEQKSLEAAPLMKGMKSVVDKGNAAVADARSMNEGISQKLAIQRTFVFKR